MSIENELKNQIKIYRESIVAFAVLIKIKKYPKPDKVHLNRKCEDGYCFLNIQEIACSKKISDPDNKIVFANIGQTFLGNSYEIIKKYLGKEKTKELEKYPVFEFFYHCRNASFHNNKFVFTFPDDKKCYPKNAIWKNELKILPEDEGKVLFYDKLGNGDPEYLVNDIVLLLKELEII